MQTRFTRAGGRRVSSRALTATNVWARGSLFVLAVGAQRGGVRIHLGAEVTQADERLGLAGVLEGDAGIGAVFGAEGFIFGQFGEADELGAVEGLADDLAAALDADEAVGAFVLDGALDAGLDGQLLGREELLTVDLAIDDPAVHEAVLAGVGDGNGFEVVVVLEAGVDVGIPVKLVHDEVEVLVLALGHVLDEQVPGDVAAFDHALIHAEDVGAPLGFVGAERAGGVEDAGADEPAGAGLEAVGFGEVEDAVVAFVPIGDAFADLGFGGAGFEAEEGVGEVDRKSTRLNSSH